MKTSKTSQFRHRCFCTRSGGVLRSVQGAAQDSAPDVGPHPPQPLERMESHVGNVTGHAKDAKMRLPPVLCRLPRRSGRRQWRERQWLDPKPRDFTIATFKCRSTPTGTLPTDQDLFNTIGRGFTNSNMPIWNTFSRSAARRSGRLHQDVLATLGEREGRRSHQDSGRAAGDDREHLSRQGTVHQAGMLEVSRASRARETVLRRRLLPTARISRSVRTTLRPAGTIPASSADRPIRISTRSS